MSTDNIMLVLSHTGGIPSDAECRRLAAEVASGNAAARERMITGNLPLISYALDKMGVPHGLRDDAFQEACIGLNRAVDLYNPEHGSRSKFSSYAFWWIRQSIQAVLRRDSIRLTHEKEIDENGIYPVDHHFPEAEIDVRRLLRRVTKRERKTLENIMHGTPLQEIGDEMGVCKERVRQIREVALEKLRERVKV